jgi:transcriptional regulator with XRE-family HTH domain
MIRNNVKKKLLRSHITQASIAREMGVSEVFVHFVVTRKARSRRVEEEIARRLGMRREELFGLNQRESKSRGVESQES